MIKQGKKFKVNVTVSEEAADVLVKLGERFKKTESEVVEQALLDAAEMIKMADLLTLGQLENIAKVAGWLERVTLVTALKKAFQQSEEKEDLSKGAS